MELRARSAPPTKVEVARIWFPLALSWLLMGAELPMLTATVARMADPEIHLAAYGSVVFPIALIIEAPIIMLLAASTALCRDLASYHKVHRFTTLAGATLTALHAVLAFTPLFDLVVVRLLQVPDAIVEPARVGLRIMLPWTWAIADRRFHQGVLIRFQRTRAISLGTLARLVSNGLVLLVGFHFTTAPGIVVGTSAISAGVLTEALFVFVCARRVVHGPLAREQVLEPALDRRAFLAFYAPLALTPLFLLASQPIATAAVARMPDSLPSLAAWPAVFGLVFLPRSLGFALNEVVVAQLGRPGARRPLFAFALLLAAASSILLLAIATTPLAELWFGRVAGLSAELTELASGALVFALVMPGVQAMQSWYQGVLVEANQTRAITEAVVLYLVVTCAVLAIGVELNRWKGIYFALGALSCGMLVQTAWLAWRSRGRLAALAQEDTRLDPSRATS